MIINLTKNQPKENTSSHHEIQEYLHTIETESGPSTWTELTIRNEQFKATAHSLDDIIHFQDLIETPSTRQGSTENSQCLSLSVETQTLANSAATPNGKNLFRICIVNEQGERVLDTLVAP